LPNTHLKIEKAQETADFPLRIAISTSSRFDQTQSWTGMRRHLSYAFGKIGMLPIGRMTNKSGKNAALHNAML
jgi:hypothetical protein